MNDNEASPKALSALWDRMPYGRVPALYVGSQPLLISGECP